MLSIDFELASLYSLNLFRLYMTIDKALPLDGNCAYGQCDCTASAF